ncbi:DUF4349 domain-containing protein [Lutimonas halocynthiae]|uniref:DUF4349 domain-containing protein n=1 Tax=Lutimonas halocynthiae TaxID=1446477 RepID=UPI0025B2F19A|nr:DUF4349 domain-containing protein [Lutimonas halocynthiae]MDN3643147.1 DUF4349 domain-containing protein [Lutimonas halocynthiae]
MKRKLLLIIFSISIMSCTEKETINSDLRDIDDIEIPITQRILEVKPPPPASERFEIDESEIVEIIEEEEIEDQTDHSNQIEKKIIKDGRIGVEVDDLEGSKIKIDQLVKLKGAYYSKDRFDDSEYESSYFLKIRIPSVEFESFVSEFGSYNGKVIYKEIKSRDVTSEFLDLETRLTNKRKYLEKYRDLLSKAKTVKDILEIENEIRGLEEEIESTVGRLKYLKDLVGYSTLDLVLTKKKDFKYTPEAEDSFVERLKESFSNGWKTVVNFILIIFGLWPLWLLLPLMIYIFRKYRKNRKVKE